MQTLIESVNAFLADVALRPQEQLEPWLLGHIDQLQQALGAADPRTTDARGEELTARQQQILTFLESYKIQNGYGPSIRDVMKHFGIRSPNGVSCHLRALIRKGVLKTSPRAARSMVWARSG